MSNAEQDKNEELIHLLGSIKDYPFGELKGTFNFRAEYPLDRANFESSGANNQVVSFINTALKHHQIAIFVSHLKMGTTSIGRAWIAEFPQIRNEVSMFDYKNKNIDIVRQRFKGDEFFIDELTTDAADLQVVDSLITDGKKLLLRPHLTGVDIYREKFKQGNIAFTEVPLKPISTAEMQNYLAGRFNLGVNDPFVKFITALSGGSLRVANELSSEFTDLIGEGRKLTQSDIVGVLNTSHDALYGYFRDIADRRRKLTDELKGYLPSPGLQRLKDGPMGVIKI